MQKILESDRRILRELAKEQLEYAHSAKNEKIVSRWRSLAQGTCIEPTVRLCFGAYRDEVIHPRLRCTEETARRIEAQLLTVMTGSKLFGDDTPIPPYYYVQWKTWVSPFGSKPNLTHSSEKKSSGYHINPVVEDLERDMDKLRGGSFGADPDATKEKIELLSDILGDILPVKVNMPSLIGEITNPLVQLMGMENYYLAMYDYPDELHEVMEMATKVYEEYYDFLEKERLLAPTADFSRVNQDSFAFNTELPCENVTRTEECWGFLESQETTAVSPELFGEFVFPYQDRLAKRFGLLSYGCCERVDAIWEPYLSKWKNLRRLSVSPFNNQQQVGEYLRGSNVVFYCKPRAELITNPGPLDEEAIQRYFKEIGKAASGCLLEVAQRDVGTIFGDYERGRQYVQLIKKSIEKYWNP